MTILAFPFDIYFAISRSVFKRKILIFDTQGELFLQFIAPVLDKLKNDSRFGNVTIHVTTTKINIKIYFSFLFNIYLGKKNIQVPIHFVPYIKNFNFFVTPHFYSPIKNPEKSILIQHNLPVKYIFPPKKFIKNSRIQFITGNLHLTQFLDSLIHYDISEEYFKIYNVGFPKTDELFNSSLNRDNILKKRNLDVSKKTILYAPSWDEGLSLKTFRGDIIDSLIKFNQDYNVIIRPHPILFTDSRSPDHSLYTGGVDWCKEFFNKINEHNVYLSRDSNSNWDIVCADLLISDVSSISWDFLIMGKPVLLYSAEKFFEDICKKIYKEYGNTHFTSTELMKNNIVNGGRNYSEVFHDLYELEDKIGHVLRNYQQNDSKTKEIKSQLLFNPGCASIKFVDVLFNLLMNN